MKKISELKIEVFGRLNVNSTNQLKREYKSIADGKDFRFKATWIQVLEYLNKRIDLGQMTNVIQQSMQRIGRAFGESYQETEDHITAMKTRVQLNKVVQGKDRLVGGGI